MELNLAVVLIKPETCHIYIHYSLQLTKTSQTTQWQQISSDKTMKTTLKHHSVTTVNYFSVKLIQLVHLKSVFTCIFALKASKIVA